MVVNYLANWRRGPTRRQARSPGSPSSWRPASGWAWQRKPTRSGPPACITRLIIDRQEGFIGYDSPYLKVNTNLWEVDSLSGIPIPITSCGPRN
jgi:hypothetical protein